MSSIFHSLLLVLTAVSDCADYSHGCLELNHLVPFPFCLPPSFSLGLYFHCCGFHFYLTHNGFLPSFPRDSCGTTSFCKGTRKVEVWCISVTLFCLNYAVKDNLCRHFCPEVLVYQFGC